MQVDVHNPDQYMISLRQIIAQGRKRIGLLVGAGAPASLRDANGDPLIPTVEGLTTLVLGKLKNDYGSTLDAITTDTPHRNIEAILSYVRSLSQLIGSTKLYGLDGVGYAELSKAICNCIGEAVNKELPDGPTGYQDIVTWISGTARRHPIEIFTTNYDLLFEKALERSRTPYFDGFAGAAEPFFDPSTVSTNDLPPRWPRLWKLHGSLGWAKNAKDEVIRCGGTGATLCIFPEHLKYDQTQKAPYSALFDRLKDFLLTPDSLLVAVGFSFADSHISSRIDECLAANPTANLFAFQFRQLKDEPFAHEVAGRRANMSVFASDQAVINGVAAQWMPRELPSKDWGPIRATYWRSTREKTPPEFVLGDFAALARFFSSSRAMQEVVFSRDSGDEPTNGSISKAEGSSV